MANVCINVHSKVANAMLVHGLIGRNCDIEIQQMVLQCKASIQQFLRIPHLRNVD